MAGLRLITPPALEPIGLAEAKRHLRIDQDDDDVLVDSLIKIARQDLDGREGRGMGLALITQTWELVLDLFPIWEIRLPLRPLQTIESIKYDDVNGAEQTFPSADYVVDIATYMGRVVPAPNKSWPGTRDGINAVRVQFKAGYGTSSASVPAMYRHALLLMVGHLYAHRGDGVPPDVPSTYFTLIGVRGRVA